MASIIRFRGSPRPGVGSWNLTLGDVEFSFQGPPATATPETVRSAAIMAGGRYAITLTPAEELAFRRWLAGSSEEIRTATVERAPRRAPVALEAFL